jgi:hypothetical protein
VKLAFGVPWTSPFMWTGFTDSIMALNRPTAARNAMGDLVPLETRYFRGAGWCPARRHIAICEQALEWGADLILILGADQTYDPDLLERLVARWNEGYEVVSALVPARGFIGWQEMEPFQRMAWRVKAGDTDALLRGEQQNEIEVVDPDAGDMQLINFIGSGVLMFHRDHLLALKAPWFRESINPETYERLASMDTGFVGRLQFEAGAKVWVDTTIDVKHLHAMPVDKTFAGRFSDYKEPGVGPRDICQFAPFGAT